MHPSARKYDRDRTMKWEDAKSWILTIVTLAILVFGLWLMQVNPGGYQVMPP